MLAREAHEVPVDEEELGQAGLLDDLELALQALGHVRGDGPIARAHAFEAELVEVRERRLAWRHGIAREADLAKVEVDVALLGDLPRRGEGFCVVFEDLAQLVAGLEAVLCVGEEVRSCLV